MDSEECRFHNEVARLVGSEEVYLLASYGAGVLPQECECPQHCEGMLHYQVRSMVAGVEGKQLRQEIVVNYENKVCHEDLLRFLHRKTRSGPESVGGMLGVLVVDGILQEKGVVGFEGHLARKLAVHEYEYYTSECSGLEGLSGL